MLVGSDVLAMMDWV